MDWCSLPLNCSALWLFLPPVDGLLHTPDSLEVVWNCEERDIVSYPCRYSSLQQKTLMFWLVCTVPLFTFLSFCSQIFLYLMVFCVFMCSVRMYMEKYLANSLVEPEYQMHGYASTIAFCPFSNRQLCFYTIRHALACHRHECTREPCGHFARFAHNKTRYAAVGRVTWSVTRFVALLFCAGLKSWKAVSLWSLLCSTLF